MKPRKGESFNDINDMLHKMVIRELAFNTLLLQLRESEKESEEELVEKENRLTDEVKIGRQCR